MEISMQATSRIRVLITKVKRAVFPGSNGLLLQTINYISSSNAGQRQMSLKRR